MLFGPRSRLFAPLAVLLAAACGRTPQQPAPDSTEHEALREAITSVQADTRVTKSNTEILKTDVATVKVDAAAGKTLLEEVLADLATVKGDGSTLRAGTDTIQTGLVALGNDVTALKNSVGTSLNTQLSAVESSLGTPPSGSSLYSTFMAARRYSLTCKPGTDTWLRSAWPGMSDPEITEACLRDGRWHYLGSMRDFITGTIRFPKDMELGLTSYSDNISPATVNGWNRGIRLCLPLIAVGDVHIVNGSSLVHECITFMDGRFTATHKLVDQTATEYSQRDYGNYAGGSETNLPCTDSGGLGSCTSNESFASHWGIYVRQ